MLQSGWYATKDGHVVKVDIPVVRKPRSCYVVGMGNIIYDASGRIANVDERTDLDIDVNRYAPVHEVH